MIEQELVESEESTKELDATLRPRTFKDFQGQKDLKDQLKIFLTAAKKRGEAMEHVLFYGPPGLGKTTLANILASEMGTQIKITSGPAIERAGDLASLLTNVQEGDIIFIDEIHRLNKNIEEILYPAMEDMALDIILGKGPSARTVRLELPKFTLIGATTQVGKLSSPLRDRFGVLHRLSYYSPEELVLIVHRASSIIGVELGEGVAELVAFRSRGTPRIANRLLKRVRDYAQVAGVSPISEAIVVEALVKVGVDEKGLNKEDKRYLELLIGKFDGGPVGIKTIAAALSEDLQTVEEVIEPYLMQLGFLKRTAQGRQATPSAYEYLGYQAPQQTLL